MRAVKAGGVFKGNQSALQCVLETHTFATSLCCRQKALLEPHSACGQLCAEQATGPFSVCVLSSPSLHTYIWSLFTLCRYLSFELSPSFSLALCPHFVVIFLLCFTKTVALFRPLVLWPRALCKATRKRVVSHACLCLHATLHSFQKLPFLPCDPLS